MFSPKDPQETITLTFDFSALAVSVSSVTVTAAVADGAPGDASPSTILSGSPTINGASVLQKIVGGVSGMRYDMRCKVTAPDGSVYVLSEILPVQSV